MDLTPVLSLGATNRDLAMAYYQALLGGNPSVESTAWKLLREQRPALASDTNALDAFGLLSAEHGERQDAEEAFQQVLKLDPRDLTALSNLGILRAKEGKLQASLALLQLAFDANQDVAGLAMNLARLQCTAGDTTAARATLEEAMVYAPGLQSLRRMRDHISDCSTRENYDGAR
jgi:tetratricopeptide (TPR) repeat protein